MTIGRSPLPSALTWLANHLTTSQEPYDKLFHLFLVCDTSQGKVLLEKNEVINIQPFRGFKERDETMVLHNIPRITVDQLLENARKKMGENDFWEYSSNHNNCQKFVLNLLEASHIYQGKQFILQDTASIYEHYPDLRKATNTITDIASRFDVLRQGGNIVNGGSITPNHIYNNLNNRNNYSYF